MHDIPKDSEGAFFVQGYERMFYQGGISGALTEHIHRALEKKFRRTHFENVLDVGGGSGKHVKFVHHTFANYTVLDPLDFESQVVPLGPKFRFIKSTAEAMPITSSCIDRVILMCVLHHVGNVGKALEECRRISKNGGVISIYLPSDPGFLYRQMRKIITIRRAKQIGMDYEYTNAIEHKNHVFAIKRIIHKVFEKDQIASKRFPSKLLSLDLSIYEIIHITISKSENQLST